MQRRKFNMKAKLGGAQHISNFKRLFPCAFNMGFIGSTCTALPGPGQYNDGYCFSRVNSDSHALHSPLPELHAVQFQ